MIDNKSAELGHRRRRSDQGASNQRALNWTYRAGDVNLCPHSPLALADVLGNDSGCFDLIAKDQRNGDDEPLVTDSGNVASLQQRKQRKHPRTRANLLTDHSQEELLVCCKQIQVENALVKRAGLKRLYLAAGFLTWQDDTEQDNQKRAPLLLFPVTLVRKITEDSTRQTDTNTEADTKAVTDSNSEAEVKTDKDAETSKDENVEEEDDFVEYEVRVASTIPEANGLLAHWCLANREINLPDYRSTEPLQDYFSRVAEAISGSDLSLQFEIALGNAAPPEEQLGADGLQVQLPALPEHFDSTLAKAIAGDKSLQQLSSVLNLLKDYANRNTEQLPHAANEAAGAVSTLHEYAKKLVAAGLGNVEFQHMAGLPGNMEAWSENISQAMESTLLTDVLDDTNLTARSLIRLAGAMELIDKAPLNIEQFKHADLAYSATPGLLQRAKHQARLIDDELSTLQNTFLLDKVPAKKQLLSLIEELGGSLDEGPDIIDADYFNARRQFMEFSIEKPTNLTPEHRAMLGKLAKVLRFRELFVNNIEYRLALGPGYRGLRTDWDTLTDIVNYSQEITEVLESESLSACVLANWEQFRTTYVSEFDVLQNAAQSLRKLLWICGADWQNKPVHEVMEHANNTRVKLMAWNDIYGETEAHRKTPANILAQFSGHSHEDVITEIHVDETQATIDKHISGGETSTETVIETIEWLRQASQTASEHQLDITDIVEHLKLA